MTTIEHMYDLIDQGQPVIWELRKGSETLGILSSNGWSDVPWIGGDFRSMQAFEHYRHLFDEYNHVPIIRGETPSGLVYVASGISRKNEIMEQIKALKLILVPINENALPGTVEEIVIADHMEAQLRVDFEEPNEAEN